MKWRTWSAGKGRWIYRLDVVVRHRVVVQHRHPPPRLSSAWISQVERQPMPSPIFTQSWQQLPPSLQSRSPSTRTAKGAVAN